MESPLLGLILDSSVIIAAERKRQTVEDLLMSVGQAFGEVEIAISAVTLAEFVHGVARANTPEIRIARRAFIDELKKHVPVHPVTDGTAEIAGQISGEQAAKGITLPALRKDPRITGAPTLANRTVSLKHVASAHAARSALIVRSRATGHRTSTRHAPSQTRLQPTRLDDKGAARFCRFPRGRATWHIDPEGRRRIWRAGRGRYKL
jgi:predicted nucleic acid-binding protein